MNVLVVAYYHLPLNSGGSHQGPVKFAEHLRRHRHRVTILTHSYGRAPAREPDTIRIPDPSHAWDRRGGHLVTWLLQRLLVEAANVAGAPASIYGIWRRRTLAATARIRSHADPDVILATYPPLEDLEIGLELSSALGIPLVADFRDGVMFEPVERRRLARHACIRRHHRAVERRVAGSAAAIVTAFPRLSRYFAEEYGVRRAVTLPNGYDLEEMGDAELPWSFQGDAFNLVHTGRFGGSDADRDMGPLCAAVEKVLEQDHGVGARLRLHQVGTLTRGERRRCASLVERGVVVCHGLHPLPVALASQRRADGLLLMTSVARPGHAPGKLFEYLPAGPPILSLSPPGSYCESVLEETGTGFAVDPRDEVAIAGALRDLIIGSGATRKLRRDEEAVAAFSRERQAMELEGLLRGVVEAG